MNDPKTRKTTLVFIEHDFAVSGYKRSVVIKFMNAEVERHFTPDLALELADLLDRHIPVASGN